MTSLTTGGLYLPMVGAGASITTGVSLKNTGKDLWGMDLKIPGMVLFIGGWLLAIVAFYLKYSGQSTPFNLPALLIAAPVLGIVGTAMMMNMKMKEGLEVPMFLPITFIASWLIFVSAIAFSGPRPNPKWLIVLPFIAAFNVFLGMMWLLPKEREAKVADGLGLVIFFIAFLLLALYMGRT
jgi:hypothetical protein